MFRLLLVLMIISPSICFSQTEDSYKPAYAVALDATHGKEMMEQCSRSTPKVKKFWNLTKTDIDSLEQHFNKVLSLQSFNGFRIINLRNYAFQYLGITIGKKKFIYVNAFQLQANKSPDDDYKNWKTSSQIGCDGGLMFWGAVFDIESKQFSDLAINGGG